MRKLLPFAATLLIFSSVVACAESPSAATELAEPKAINATSYRLEFATEFASDTTWANVSMVVSQPAHNLRRLKLRAPKTLFRDFSGSAGTLSREDDQVTWEIPEQGGTLQWRAQLNVPKGDSWDARATPQWALLRFEDLLPSSRSTAVKGSSGDLRLTFSTPKNWSVVTRYGRYNGTPLKISTPGKTFSRPTGWLIAGDLGVRRETVAERKFSVAAPVGSRFPRIPLLAFLNWTMPEFVRALPMTPEEILIVSGDQSMWRGALSGPSSLYLHSARPLISENGTSALLHELVHVATRFKAAPGDDWIVEGIAEYYSLEILRRSGGLSATRFAAALKDLEDWAKDKSGTLAHPSKGADTAQAVLLFHAVAQELGEDAFDQVVQHLAGHALAPKEVSRQQLVSTIKAVTGKPSKALERAMERYLP